MKACVQVLEAGMEQAVQEEVWAGAPTRAGGSGQEVQCPRSSDVGGLATQETRVGRQ